MSYKVSIYASYPDGSILKLAFDTNSALLHEAYNDAEQELFMARLLQNKTDIAIKKDFTFKPCNDAE